MNGRTDAVLRAGIWLLLIFNISLAWFWVRNEAFDPDEFQHTHIAWLIAEGQVLYRDFWEAHGPVYAYLNGLLLAATGMQPGLHVAFLCRGLSVLELSLLYFLTYRIGRHVRLPPVACLLGLALLSALVFVQDKGTECRPDNLQNLLWLAGLLCVLAGIRRDSWRWSILGGLGFGLAVLTNPKAAFGPALTLAYLLFGRRVHGLQPSSIRKQVLAVIVPGLCLYAASAGYFWRHGALREFHVYNSVWFFHAIFNDNVTYRSWDYLGFMVKRQLAFSALSALGLWLWVADLRRRGGVLDVRAGWLVAIAAVGTALTIFSNDYNQIFLLFLPLWSLFAGLALWRLACGTAWPVRAGPGRAGRALMGAEGRACLLGLVAVCSLLVTLAGWVPTRESSRLQEQRELTARLLNQTARDEPIGVIWNNCGGYMFNANLQYFWIAEQEMGRVMRSVSGFDPAGGSFVDALERGRVRFVVGDRTLIYSGLPAGTRRYLAGHYDHSGCLWTRRDG